MMPNKSVRENTKERIADKIDDVLIIAGVSVKSTRDIYTSQILGLFLSPEEVGCKYAVISHGIGIDGKVTEATIHCEFNPEIDYTVALSTTLKPSWTSEELDKVWICEECNQVFANEEKVKDCAKGLWGHICKAKKYKEEHRCESYLEPYCKQALLGQGGEK